MVAIVRSFGFPAAELQNLSRIPSTDELRPCHCPSCGVAAGDPGGLKLVGHGLYERQLLGLADAPEGVVIRIRRFLCLACRRTACVLPDEVLPGRWYAGAAILLALVLALINESSAKSVRTAVSPCQVEGVSPRRWRSLERWASQLLSPLWRWKAPELGAAEPATDRPSQRSRLQHLLAHLGVCEPYPPDEIDSAARSLVQGTAHSSSMSWLISRTA